MKQGIIWPRQLIVYGAAVFLIVTIVFLVRFVSNAGAQPAQETQTQPDPQTTTAQEPTKDSNGYPSTFAPPTEATYGPEPTIEPPTPWPSPPQVTVIPTTSPPIATSAGPDERPFSLIVRDGRLLRAIDSSTGNEVWRLDLPTRLSLFLAPFEQHEWGNVAADGRVALVLTNFETAEAAPSEGQAPTTDIYIYDPLTDELHFLVSDGMQPVWSPDGLSVAYRSSQTFGLWLVDVASGVTREIFAVDRAQLDYWVNYAAWSPDSQQIAIRKTFSLGEDGEVWRLDLVSGQSTLLLSDDSGAYYFEWSPLSDQLLYVSYMGERAVPSDMLNLWILDLESLKAAQLTQNIFVEGPAWSADGNWISFAGRPKLESDLAPYDLWQVSPATQELRRLTNDETYEHRLAWDYGSNQLVYVKTDLGIWAMDLATAKQRQLYPDATNYLLGH